MSSTSGHFPDIKERITSAAVMVLVGVMAVWAGGTTLLVLLALIAAVMFWELLRMVGPNMARLPVGGVCVIAAASIILAGQGPGLFGLAGLFVAPLGGFFLLKRDRGLFWAYGMAILLAVAGIFWLRQGGGLVPTLWLVLVVVAADVGGYCFGRVIGGAKIFPAISPKKTWSGTLGGLALAALVGGAFSAVTPAGAGLVLVSVLTAAASQAGDVVESAIKRHSGVKDSSNLIPGHGGFLDRFDALIVASLFAMLASWITGLPALGLV